MRSWWSRTYNRPLKDELLDSYTLYELIYEYQDHIQRELAAKDKLEEESDKIEDRKVQEALDWAEQEELKELEAARQKQAEEQGISEEDREWMEQEIKRQKEIHGDDFGEDLSFGDD